MTTDPNSESAPAEAEKIETAIEREEAKPNPNQERIDKLTGLLEKMAPALERLAAANKAEPPATPVPAPTVREPAPEPEKTPPPAPRRGWWANHPE